MKRYPSWSSGIPEEGLVVPVSCESDSTVSIQALCKVFMLVWVNCIGQWLQWVSPDQHVLEITSLHLFCWKQVLETISFSSRRRNGLLENYKLDNLQIREKGFFPSVSVHSSVWNATCRTRIVYRDEDLCPWVKGVRKKCVGG